MIVVDSSVLIAFFRGHQHPAVERLVGLETAGVPFALPGFCFQEAIQGARDEREWRLLEEYLGSQTLIFSPDPAFTHREAARIFYDCRRRGLTIRNSVDCFISSHSSSWRSMAPCSTRTATSSTSPRSGR